MFTLNQILKILFTDKRKKRRKKTFANILQFYSFTYEQVEETLNPVTKTGKQRKRNFKSTNLTILYKFIILMLRF